MSGPVTPAGCKLCGKPLAYPGALFCGAACSAQWEGGRRTPEDLHTVADVRISHMTESRRARLWSKVEVRRPDECWPRIPDCDRFALNKKVALEFRRAVWLVTHGSLPSAKQHVEVTCENVRCCNPAHLISPTRVERFWAKVRKTDTCWIWTGPVSLARRGYGVFRIQAEKHGGTAPAHRYSYELHNGPIPSPELFVCHTCDNPPCVNPAHLFLGTAKDNHDDMMAKGRHSHGERHSEIMRRTREREAS